MSWPFTRSHPSLMSQLDARVTAWILLGLSSLAVAIPLLGTLGHGATFFVVHGAAPLGLRDADTGGISDI